ncbi:hypothetical protein OG373_41150 [Streptomyces avidinii]|uniref:hypothetical protein n=1 Tax=Streptomyces TaxID=1883 RepID=UPI0034292918|nr:hypothetical protein OG373_00025 [Streptomyces avidinii]WTB02258.1 hypothetical protein OG373_41150 [Streptomyces avidinii]
MGADGRPQGVRATLSQFAWCPEHGVAAGPLLEWHAGGGLRCAQLTRGRAGSA